MLVLFWIMRNTYSDFVRKFKADKSLQMRRCSCDNNIKMDLKSMECVGVD
jgi:hypothetical protein